MHDDRDHARKAYEAEVDEAARTRRLEMEDDARGAGTGTGDYLLSYDVVGVDEGTGCRLVRHVGAEEVDRRRLARAAAMSAAGFDTNGKESNE